MTMLVTSASKLVGRPVKVEWSRQQTFALAGHRPATWQTVRLGASGQGKLVSLEHVARSHTSIVSDFPEACTGMTSMMYDVENLGISHDLRHLNLPKPLPMRGPGEMTGGWALECAMDEPAYEVGRDPIDVRMENYAHVAPFSGLPFSSKHLLECCDRGRELLEGRSESRFRALFGWATRGSGLAFPATCIPPCRAPRLPAQRSTRMARRLCAVQRMNWGTARGRYSAKLRRMVYRCRSIGWISFSATPASPKRRLRLGLANHRERRSCCPQCVPQRGAGAEENSEGRSALAVSQTAIHCHPSLRRCDLSGRSFCDSVVR